MYIMSSTQFFGDIVKTWHFFCENDKFDENRQECIAYKKYTHFDTFLLSTSVIMFL